LRLKWAVGVAECDAGNVDDGAWNQATAAAAAAARDTLGLARGKFFVAMRMRGKTGAQSGVSMITRGGPLTGDGCCALAMAAA
jgi:hypothetical protein